jgi:hypothetical protein
VEAKPDHFVSCYLYDETAVRAASSVAEALKHALASDTVYPEPIDMREDR